MDFFVVNGKIWQGNGRFCDAMVLRGGRIADTGREELLEKSSRGCARLDCGGRLVIPGIFGIVMYLIGLRGIYLLIPLLVLSMPIGVNIVVFPESCGIDARDNAKTVFLSYILAAGILPLTFSLISHLSGI